MKEKTRVKSGTIIVKKSENVNFENNVLSTQYAYHDDLCTIVSKLAPENTHAVIL